MARLVREAMTADPVCLAPDTPLIDAAVQMREYDIGDVLIAEQARVYGMLTDRDIVVRALAEGKDPARTTVGEIASGRIVTVAPDDPVSRAVELMREHAVRRLPVCQDGRSASSPSATSPSNRIPGPCWQTSARLRLTTEPSGGAWLLPAPPSFRQKALPGMAEKLIAVVLDRYGPTSAEEAGTRLADRPAALYQLLILATLLSARISAGVAVAAARELFAAGYRTPRAMSE